MSVSASPWPAVPGRRPRERHTSGAPGIGKIPDTGRTEHLLADELLVSLSASIC